MPVESLTAGVCSHSHLWNPFCPHEDLLTRVMKVVAVVIAAIAAYMIYHIWGPDSSDDTHPSPCISETPPTSTPPQQSPQSTSHFAPAQPPIQLEDGVSKIPEIVKVSLKILQQRAVPATSGGETTRGFIKAEQSLLEVIQSDWNTARRLEMTHVEIADHLQFIVEAARARTDQEKSIPYDYLTKTSDSEKTVDVMPRFIVRIIEDSPRDTDIFRSAEVSSAVGASTEEVLIVNTAVQGKYIRWRPLREKYIREFGFYSLGMEIETVEKVLRGRIKI